MRRFVSILATLFLVGGVAVTVAANPAAVAASSRPAEYLALGDSIAFGFSPLASPTSADNFIGYPDKVAAALNEHLTNAGCPGETSSHFIDLAGSDNNCAFFRANFPSIRPTAPRSSPLPMSFSSPIPRHWWSASTSVPTTSRCW